jgi:hypothetical protein
MFRRLQIFLGLAGSSILAAGTLLAQVPATTPVPVPPASQPAASGSAPPLRLTDPLVVSISRLPSENPFGAIAESPAQLPSRPALPEALLPASLFVTTRVDATGKVQTVRRARDPIPSASAETQKDLSRWTYEPARKGGQKVAAWAPLRLDLIVEVDEPKIDQMALTSITPSTPLPAPFEWPADGAWYEAVKSPPSSDGTLPVEQLDTLATPKRTPFPDSHKGPFSCRFWIKVGADGRLQKAIAIAASDPILIPYFRRVMSGWQLRPARVKGASAETWNELAVSGTFSYSVDIKQIVPLRKGI